MDRNDKTLIAKITKYLDIRQAKLEQYIEGYNRETSKNIETGAFLVMLKDDKCRVEHFGRTFDLSDLIVRKAVEICLENGKFSTAMLQAKLGKGHGWVSGLALWLEEIGAIGPMNGNKPRDLLITTMDEFDELAKA